MYSGLICSSSVTVRRITFVGTDRNIKGKMMYIWQYDDSMTGLRNLQSASSFDKDAYLVKENAGQLEWLEKARPNKHWTVPYVTGHKYYIRWLHGLDFENVEVQIIPWLWEDADNVELVMPHYETRAAIEFTTDVGGL